MAKQTITIDDLTGKPIEGPVTPTVFTYMDREFELDLGPDSRAKLEQALEPFIAAAAPKKTRHLVPPETIRAWAKTQGIAVSNKGRLADAVSKAYNQAHGHPQP